MPSSSTPITIAGRPKRSLRRLATIPTTPGCQPLPDTTINGSSAAASRLFERRSVTSLLDRAAFLVQSVEFGGDCARFLRIGGGQQPHAQIGLADATAGVDPRAEREAEIARAWRFDQPRRIGKRGQADVAACRP